MLERASQLFISHWSLQLPSVSLWPSLVFTYFLCNELFRLSKKHLFKRSLLIKDMESPYLWCWVEWKAWAKSFLNLSVARWPRFSFTSFPCQGTKLTRFLSLSLSLLHPQVFNCADSVHDSIAGHMWISSIRDDRRVCVSRCCAHLHNCGWDQSPRTAHFHSISKKENKRVLLDLCFNTRQKHDRNKL